MAVKYVETQMFGATWGLNTLATTQGKPVLFWLMHLLAESAGHVGGGLRNGGAELSEAAFANALRAITSKLDATGEIHTKTVLEGLTRNKEQIDQDLYFGGNWGEWIALVYWAMEVNFKSFFVANPLASLLAKVLRPAPSP